IRRWDGSTWSNVGTGLDSYVECFTVFDDGSGPGLYAGGLFNHAGSVPASGVARWNGTSWAPLGSGIYGGVLALLPMMGAPGGPRLTAGGFSRMTRAAPEPGDWNTARWQGCDPDPPVLTCPDSIHLIDFGAPGEFVAFTVSATDRNDPAPIVVCAP